jgi:Glycosyl transferase family 2
MVSMCNYHKQFSKVLLKCYSIVMMLLVILGVLSIVIELALFIKPFPWNNLNIRRVLSGVSLLLLTFTAIGFFVSQFTIMGFLFASICGHRGLNLLRIAEARMNEHYLRRTTFRTTVTLTLATILWAGVWYGIHTWSVTAIAWLWAIALAQIGVSSIFLLSTFRSLRKSAVAAPKTFLAPNTLPTVTVAIPARNETNELEDCIQALLRSDYPKLEILVLDDCSQLKRTPEIIRDFAHAGVRFLEGTTPHKTWFAKNHAYAQLAQEANGEILLFMGVDILVEPHTIRLLIETMIDRDKRMISILPLRHNPEKIQLSLSQATRYMWELAPPRKLFNRPPVLSSCWLIYKQDLRKFGSFAAVCRMVVPEAYFARREMHNNDSYAFLRSTSTLGLTSSKSLTSQRNTAIRVRYPALHRRPENVLILSLLEVAIIVGCFILPFSGLIGLIPPLIAILSSLAAVLFIVSYSLVVITTKVNSWCLAPLLALPAVLFDIILMHVSMWRYEFTDVLWKGRNICLPVMRVEPRLPNLK